MKTKYLILLAAFAILINPKIFAQKSKADRLFTRFEYAKAAPYYEKLAAKKNKHETYALTRLGDCYRLTRNFEASAKWYGQAVAGEGAAAEIAEAIDFFIDNLCACFNLFQRNFFDRFSGDVA